MKLSTICFIFAITCSCCRDDTLQGSAEETMTRHDEIRKIMRNHWIHLYETEDFYWWSAEERKKNLSELRKMKKDYHYELSDPNINLTIPGPGWAIRGPLTITQVEHESLEKIRESPDVPQVPFGYQNNYWNKLKSQYKEGDEFYFFGSDPVSWAYFRGRLGYVLIRDNEFVDRIVTNIS